MQSKIHIVKNQIINFMSCCIDFHYWLYYWDISELRGMSGDLSEFFPLSFHFLTIISIRLQKEEYRQFVIREIYALIKVFQRNQ